jgi:RNA polymerase sigma-70 factor (ECF subfamily)
MSVQPSDEPTLELIVRAKAGNGMAIEALLHRSLPRLRRWAHGRLPAAARRHCDTADLVQEVAISALSGLHRFEPRHPGALQAYLRRSVVNRIRDEVRKLARRPVPVALSESLPCDAPSPFERAVTAEAYDRYHRGMAVLRPKDRSLIAARVELQLTLTEIAERFAFPSTDAARVAVRRAVERLAARCGSC